MASINWQQGRPSAGSRLTPFTPPATPEQIAEVRRLGGQPRDDLTRSQAVAAIAALRRRAREREGRKRT